MMKIKYLIIPAAITLASAFTGCGEGDEPLPASKTPLVLMASVYDIDSEISSVWHSGQAFGVYMLEGGRTPLVSNERHLADNRGVTGYLVPENSALMFPTDGSSVDITAYYPYDGHAAVNGHRTTVSVKGGTAPDAFLWGDFENASSKSPRVTLEFKSMLSQIRARILDNDPDVARVVARMEGAPLSCGFDVLNGQYIGTPSNDSPIGVTVKVVERAFELSVVVLGAEGAPDGPSLEITALDKNGKEIRKYPSIALGEMLGLDDGCRFSPNTVYNLAGSLSKNGVDLQFTGSSPICILPWTTDPDEEEGTIIKR